MEAVKGSPTELADLRMKIADLEEKNAELVDAYSEKCFASTGRIARTIAHEIRNPLTNINLAVEQLVAELPPDDNSRFLLEMIDRNSKRVNQIISELLNSTRFSDLNLSTTFPNEMLTEVLAPLSAQLLAQNIELVTNFDPAVKEIMADKDQLKQALLNLLVNSIEAMEDKRNAILSITTAQKNDEVMIAITDNGKGLSDEDEKKVFEPYFSKKQTGLGLSLTITQNIILNHKGKIKVSTKLGEGTSFIVCLKGST